MLIVDTVSMLWIFGPLTSFTRAHGHVLERVLRAGKTNILVYLKWSLYV